MELLATAPIWLARQALTASSASVTSPASSTTGLDPGTGAYTFQMAATLILAAGFFLGNRLRRRRGPSPGSRREDPSAPAGLVRRGVVSLLAVLAPPLLVLSSAHELFLRSQWELDRMVSVLHPFWTVGAGVAALGLALTRLAHRRPGRLALVAYYVAGLGFMVWCFARALPLGAHLMRWLLDTGPGALIFAGALAGAVALVSRKVAPRTLEPYFAVLAVVLLAREAIVFGRHLDRSPAPPPRDIVAEVGEGGDTRLPNVYHLILDSFQDELFEPALPPGGETALAGFVRFHLISRSHATSVALPAILTGGWVPTPSAKARIRSALTGEASLPQRLRGAGYRTMAVVPRYIYGSQPSAFDVVVLHDENVTEPDAQALNAAAFLRLWVFRTLPRALVVRLDRGSLPGLGAGFFDMRGVDRIASFPTPLLHRLSFERLLDLEPRLPPRGRYTLVHVALPHKPFRLRSDCSMAPGLTDLAQQTDCSLRLLVRFVQLLRRLDRLDEATILVHGDHGMGLARRGGHFVEDESAWSRTLLLTRLPGATGPLRSARETARLEDIAPTLLSMLGIGPPMSSEGRPLVEALPPVP